MRVSVATAVLGLALASCNPFARLGMLPEIPESPRPPDALCSGEACGAAPRVVEPRAPASLWSVRFVDGIMHLPSDSSREWFGLVVRGELQVTGCGKVGPYQAYRVRGGGVRIEGRADVVFGVASDSPLDGASPPETMGRVEPSPGRCERADLLELPDVAWAGGHAHARLVFRTPRAYFGLLHFEPGTPGPIHQHSAEWELVHVLRGAGEAQLGDEVGPIVPGITFAIPPGQPHGTTLRGEEPVVAVQLYTPPGPEARFLELAKDR